MNRKHSSAPQARAVRAAGEVCPKTLPNCEGNRKDKKIYDLQAETAVVAATEKEYSGNVEKWSQRVVGAVIGYMIGCDTKSVAVPNFRFS